MFKVDKLTKKYGKKKALDNFSWTIENKTGIYAVLGQNGAGKTTLFNCLSGKKKLNSGNNVKVNNLNLEDFFIGLINDIKSKALNNERSK